MRSQQGNATKARMRSGVAAALVAAGLLCAAGTASAQTATIYGSLFNFDVVNNTGQDACGFQVEVEGLDTGSLMGTFDAQRYGTPTVEPYALGAVSGTRITWRSSNCSTNKTIAHPPGTAFGGSCYSWNTLTYPTSGCEHFGVRYNVPGATTVTYRWLVASAADPTAYVPHDPAIPIASPTYYVPPPPPPAGGGTPINPPPVVVAQVEAPEPAEAPELYGNAQWIKVFVQQLPRAVTLDELITENPLVVPMDPALQEINWDVIQAEPASNSNGNRRRSQKRGSSTLDATTRTVVRRYELYAYTGAYDPVTNEALCADLTCTAPGADEIGDFISAQMTAVAVQGDFLTITKAGTGGGNVDSSDKVLSCGSKCTSPYAAGTPVTLTAKAASGSTFTGWSGACVGTGTTCTVPVNGAVPVTATFDAVVKAGGGGGGGGGGTTTYTVSVGKTNTGTVTATPNGVDRALNCGKDCSVKFASGTTVTLTATPPAGKTFVNWSGGCAGTAPTCTIPVTKDTSVQAVFSK